MTTAIAQPKCKKTGCYLENRKAICENCLNEIEPNQPRHSFIDMRDFGRIQNYHCKCIPNHMNRK